MPTTAAPSILTTDDKKRLSAALTKRIGPSMMPHTYRRLTNTGSNFLYQVCDPETGSRLDASLVPGFRMQVVEFHAPHRG